MSSDGDTETPWQEGAVVGQRRASEDLSSGGDGAGSSFLLYLKTCQLASTLPPLTSHQAPAEEK